MRRWHAVRMPTRQRIRRAQYERSDREPSPTTSQRNTLSEHVRATLREADERAALMQFQPAAGYRKVKAGGVLRG
jgi:hypothetical protein